MEDDAAEIAAAIEVINRYLDREWISDGCREGHSFGCASCSAIMLKTQLSGIANNLGNPIPSPVGATKFRVI